MNQPHNLARLYNGVRLIRIFRLLGLTLLLLSGVNMLHPRPLQAQGCSFPLSVGDESALNAAITCYNAVTTPGEYVITLAADIDLTAATVTINNATPGVRLRIDGGGFTVDGQGNSEARPVTIASNTTVAIEHITVSGGRTILSLGGGISNSGTLTVTNSTISGNNAVRLDNGSGGGIYNSGTLVVTNSTISGNGTINNRGGGGISNSGTLTVTNSTISGNNVAASPAGRGGGISNSGRLTLVNSTISDNTGAVVGSGIYNASSGVLTLANTLIANSASGGDCINEGTVFDNGHNLIEDSANACGLVNGANGNITGQDPNLGGLQDNDGPTFTHALLDGSPAIDAGDNAAALDAQGQPLATDQRGTGFLRIVNGTVDIGAFEAALACPGFPATVGSESELNQAIACYNAVTTPGEYVITLAADIALSASTTTISNATPGASLRIEGGGFTVDGLGNVRPVTIAISTTVTLENITITGGNTTGDGGGIFNAGVLTVANSTLSGNTSDNSHGAGGGNGGGIYNYNRGVLTVINSTISGNTTGNTTGNGGGIHNAGVLTVVNSTLSGNTAVGGGGIFSGGGELTMVNSTLSGNTAAAGGGIYNSVATLALANTLIANERAAAIVSITGAVTDNGHNLIEDSANACGLVNGANGNITGQDPQLDPAGLQLNGGATQNIALLPGSPALNAGANAICADPDTVNNLDQRGVTRPQPAGGQCDIGAVEMEAAPSTPVIFIGSNTNASVPGVSFRDEDIFVYDPNTDSWLFLFDGSDVGLKDEDVDAIAFLPDGRLLVSVDDDFDLDRNGIGEVDDSDILVFTPSSLGSNTSGAWAFYLDGSDVGLSGSDEDIDAIDFDENGNLVISVTGSFKAPGASGDVKGNDEDLFVLQNGVWALYFDGSDIGLTNSDEDLNSVWFDHANHKLYFSTYEDYSLPGGLKGNEDDILLCTYSSLGENTVCALEKFWDGDNDHNFDDDEIDGLAMGALPALVNGAAVPDELVVDDTVEYPGDDADDVDELDGEEEDSQDERLFLPVVKR